jgi:hypothetical protein
MGNNTKKIQKRKLVWDFLRSRSKDFSRLRRNYEELLTIAFSETTMKYVSTKLMRKRVLAV